MIACCYAVGKIVARTLESRKRTEIWAAIRDKLKLYFGFFTLRRSRRVTRTSLALELVLKVLCDSLCIRPLLRAASPRWSQNTCSFSSGRLPSTESKFLPRNFCWLKSASTRWTGSSNNFGRKRSPCDFAVARSRKIKAAIVPLLPKNQHPYTVTRILPLP